MKISTEICKKDFYLLLSYVILSGVVFKSSEITMGYTSLEILDNRLIKTHTHTVDCHCCLSLETSRSEHLDSPSLHSCRSTSLLFLSPSIFSITEREVYTSLSLTHISAVCCFLFYPSTQGSSSSK